MILEFAKKEFHETVIGPKFLITLAICLVLILTSVYTGYEIYLAERNWYARAVNESVRALEMTGGYDDAANRGVKTLREPSALSIFVKGVDSSIGKSAMIGNNLNLSLQDSRFGLNPIFAVFGELDLAFIVKLILSLFAILFSYNAISGERELGTLKQVMSYSVSRASFIIGKMLGGLTTLLMTLIVPFLIALLLLIFLPDIQFAAGDWARIAGITLVFCLYLCAFYLIGVLMSALTRNSFVSFLLGLFIWVLSIVILPKGAVELAGRISPAPSIDVIETERAALNQEYFQNYSKFLEEYINSRLNADKSNFSDLFTEAWGYAREQARADLNEKEKPLLQRYQREQLNLQRTAESLSRISPAACLTLAVSRLAGTDTELRARFFSGLRTYREEFIGYIDRLKKEYPERESNWALSHWENGKYRYTYASDNLVFPDFPQFSMEAESVESAFEGILPDIAILAIYCFALFAAAFVAFARYDVR